MPTGSTRETKASRQAARHEPPALPCLFSDNSDKEDGCSPEKGFEVTHYHKKQAFALKLEVERLIKTYGLEHIGFLTLTLPDKGVPPLDVIMRRLDNLRRRVLIVRYAESIRVLEWGTKKGRPHFHLVVVLPFDIRSGVEWGEFEGQSLVVLESVPARLREEWAFLRATLPEYGFGRHELLPVRSSSDAVSRYVGGYISKSVPHRPKGCRIRLWGLIRAHHGPRAASTRFQWHTPRTKIWRVGSRRFAQRSGLQSYEDLKLHFGPRWAWLFKDDILNLGLMDQDPELVGVLDCPGWAKRRGGGLGGCTKQEEQ
jgi:hypothetical protein